MNSTTLPLKKKKNYKEQTTPIHPFWHSRLENKIKIEKKIWYFLTEAISDYRWVMVNENATCLSLDSEPLHKVFTTNHCCFAGKENNQDLPGQSLFSHMTVGFKYT